MSDDPILESVDRQITNLQSDLEEMNINLKRAIAAGDEMAKDELVLNYARCSADIQALANGRAQYVQANQPRYEEQLTAEELHARPAHKITASDGLRIAYAGSQFEKQLLNEGWNNKLTQEGLREVQQRRREGR